jgi:hypothetical protein
MKKVSLKGFGHTSFAVISAIVGLSWGVILGAVVFVGSFLSDHIDSMIPKDMIEGIPSSIVVLLLVPAFFSVMGFFLGYLSCPVFNSFLRLANGLSVEGDMSFDELDGAVVIPVTRHR